MAMSKRYNSWTSLLISSTVALSIRFVSGNVIAMIEKLFIENQ